MDPFLEPWQIVAAALLAAAAVAAVRRFRGAAADPAVRVLEREIAGWRDHPVFDGLARELVSALAAADPPVVERELEALHFGVATVALAARGGDPEEVREAAGALSDQLADGAGRGGRSDTGERARWLRDRAARYERAVPDEGQPLDDDDLRRIGAVLASCLEAHRSPEAGPGPEPDPELLRTVGLYFVRRWEAAARALPAR